MADFFLRSFVLTFSVILIQGKEVPLGVHPSNAPFYIASKPFTCLDKSATIPWHKVNDDYCDCLDGSDEPGTSACPDMKFYCANDGHVGAFIPSGYVNDMVCDCCDGSDEYNGHVSCNNTCRTLAREKEEFLHRKREDFEFGHKIYNEYVGKKAIELEEEAKRKAEEEERRRIEEEEAKLAAVEAERTVTIPETTMEPPYAETPVDPVSTDLPDDEDKGGAEGEHVPDIPDYPDDESHHLPDDRSYITPESKPIDYGPDNGFMMLIESSTGCLEYSDKQYTYSLCAFSEVRQRNIGSPAGSGTLLGKWKEWVGHPEDSINWTREEKLEKLLYNEMLYDGGETCWNGPSRSVKVKVACGVETKLLSVDEPSRCVYLMKLETPAACHHKPEKLLQMHVEL
nr:Glucosidase II beta subunit [Hymenolepis microstoma]